jgi:peptidyl-dipeptidase A
MADKAARRILDAWTERLEPVSTARASAWWDVNLRATPEATARYRAAMGRYEEAGEDAEGFARLLAVRGEGVAEPGLARALEVLERTLLPLQAPKSVRTAIVEATARVQERYSNVRGSVGGKAVDDGEIAAILKESDDPHRRRAAWEASKEVGAAVADDVRGLARLRNEAARALGFPDHYEFELHRQEVEPARLDAFLSRMDAGTAGPFAAYRAALDARLSARFRCEPAALRPWHFEDPFFQEAPEAGRPSFDRLFDGHDAIELARRTYAGLGFDVDGVLARSDLHPRAGKCQHAFCTHVDRAGDVRVLCNVVPGERWVGTMLHELGHAVYDLAIDRELPWVLRTPPHMSSTEAVAMLFGRLSRDPEWLVPALSLPASEAAAVAAAAGVAFAESMLVFTRWVLVMARFERALYRDPEQDLDRLWWDLVERHQLVRRPEGRAAPDWAAKIHVATAPVYYHSYLMGECTASQLARRARAAAGGRLVGSPEAGAFLRERFFAPGSSRPWDAHLEEVTGSPLDPKVLHTDMGIAA